MQLQEEQMTQQLHNVIMQAIEQRKRELRLEGIPEPEIDRVITAELNNSLPPAYNWPGPVTGLDNAGTINPNLVFDSGVPLTNFEGQPDATQPYPTSNISPYGIGTTSMPYPTMPTPDPNSIGNQSNVYNVTNFRDPHDDTNWAAMGANVNAEPSMEGEEGFNVAKSIPEWQYQPEGQMPIPRIPTAQPPTVNIPPSGAIMEVTANIKKDSKAKKTAIGALAALILKGLIDAGLEQPTTLEPESDEPIVKEPTSSPDEPRTIKLEPVDIKRFVKRSSEFCKLCSPLDGNHYNVANENNRPVLPSEGKGYTMLVHPNCTCVWGKSTQKDPDTLTLSQRKLAEKTKKHIEDHAADHTLHTVKKDGKLSSRTRGTNPIREAMQGLKEQFKWLSDDYLDNAKKLMNKTPGELYLVRAASETITDHRAEGEPHRRLLSGDELAKMARTAVKTNTDINHNPDYRVDSIILDSEYDPKLKQIQMLVAVNDKEINEAIQKGKIQAVSINGGMPRNETIEKCNHDCNSGDCEVCVVPRGVILGEVDDIGFTWVVTDPKGIVWKGNFIPHAEPGVKNTKISLV